MKQDMHKTQQFVRRIQGSGINQKKGFIDNRPESVNQAKMLKSIVGSDVLQRHIVYEADGFKAVAENPGEGIPVTTSKDGYKVRSTVTNKAAAELANVPGAILEQQFGIARTKLRAGVASVNNEEHELRKGVEATDDEVLDINYIDEEEAKCGIVVQPFGLAMKRNLFSFDTAFIAQGAGLDSLTAIKEVTPAMVYAYWEREGGSYHGYQRIAEIDDRYNCAAYAAGKEKWIEPEDMHSETLDKEYKKLTDADELVVGTVYIGAMNLHFVRIEKLENSNYRIKEKNGPSGVYQKDIPAADWETEKVKYDRGIYKKK